LTLFEEGAVKRIAILDLDVHQGDGNAAILAGRPGMMLIGIQGERNFPFRRVPGHLDVELPDDTEDRAYLDALADVLPALEAHRPDLKRRTLNATRAWIDLIVAFKGQRRFRNNASKATLDLKFAPSLASR